MKIFQIVVAIMVFIAAMHAHQPRLIIGTQGTEENPIVVEEPEISKAYYAELNGKPQYYRFATKEEIGIYINILVPYTGSNVHKTFSAELLDSEGNQLALLDGTDHNWSLFYEEYGDDTYWVGPELGKDFKSTGKIPPGTYTIRLFSQDNKGRYVLAVGDRESFPASEIINAVISMPFIKVLFFGKLEFLVVPLAIVIVILFLAYRKNK